MPDKPTRGKKYRVSLEITGRYKGEIHTYSDEWVGYALTKKSAIADGFSQIAIRYRHFTIENIRFVDAKQDK